MVDAVIRLFPSNARVFTSNGIGFLPDVTSCQVTEERNGSFELTMTYPITGRHYNEIGYRSLLVAKPNPYDEPQAFRVYSMSKPIKGLVTYNAEHISYDISGYPVQPFSASNAIDAMAGLRRHSAVSCPFTFWTNKTTNAEFKIDKPVSMRSVLGGMEGSILDVYGGEYEFNNFEVKLHKARGANRGYTIRYGKNLTDLDQEENCANVYTGVYPYWYTEEDGLVESSPKIVTVEGDFDFERIYVLDCSPDYTEKPTPNALFKKAESYAKNNNIGVPKVSLNVSFVNLASSKEYNMLKIMEQAKLCDTMTIEFSKLGVKAQAECIKTVYDVINDKYVSLSLGDARSDLASTIVNNNININNNLDTVNDNIRTIITTENGLIRTEIENESKKLSTAITQTDEAIRRDLTAEVTRIDKDITETNETLSETKTELTNNIEETAKGIRTDLTEVTKTLTTKIDTTKDELQGELEETTEYFNTTIEETARGIRTDLTETRETLTNSIDEAKNDFQTEINRTTEYFNTYIESTARGIMTEVSSTYETKEGSQSSYNSLYSQYVQLAGQIVLKVDANGNMALVQLAADPSTGTSFRVKAGNINLTADEVMNLMAGGTLNLGAKNIKIVSDNFKVDEQGNVVCTSLEAVQFKGAAVNQLNDAIWNSETMRKVNEIIAAYDQRFGNIESLLYSDKILFDTLDAKQDAWAWKQSTLAEGAIILPGGWAKEPPGSSLSPYTTIDATGYNKIIVRIYGSASNPVTGSNIANHWFLNIGATNDPNSATSVLHKADEGGGGAYEGAAKETWFNLLIDISGFTSKTNIPINVFSTNHTEPNGWRLYCSKITLTNR